jgi:hypothetical protein
MACTRPSRLRPSGSADRTGCAHAQDRLFRHHHGTAPRTNLGCQLAGSAGGVLALCRRPYVTGIMMPGSWDWIRRVERLRQREPTVDARLSERLANLDATHPSSPRHADQLRRSELRSSELGSPEPSEPIRREPTRREPGRASEHGEDRIGHGTRVDRSHTNPDGSWEWKGLKLTAEQSREADRVTARYLALEGRDRNGDYSGRGLTPVMRLIEAEVGGKLAGCPEFTLKDGDRFREKLAKMIALEPDKPAAELAASIHDAVRYTLLFDGSSYTDSVLRTIGRLRESGHEMAGVKLGWQGAEYKGINTRWREPTSGLLFEVQFHTPESWDAKQQTHDAYVKIGTPGTPPGEREELRAYQMQITASVKVPDRALEIARHLEEGR